MPKFTVVPKAAPDEHEKLRQRLARRSKPATMLQCRCGCRELIEVKSGVMYVDGKTQGGTKQMICAACFARGEIVTVI